MLTGDHSTRQCQIAPSPKIKVPLFHVQPWSDSNVLKASSSRNNGTWKRAARNRRSLPPPVDDLCFNVNSFFFFWFFLSVPNLIRLIYKYATSLTIQSIIDKDLIKRTEGGLDPTRPLQSTPNIATIDQLQPTISVQRRSTGVDQLSSGLLMPPIMISNLTSSPSEYPVLSF